MSDLRTELFTKVLPKMQLLTKHTALDNLSFDDPDQPEVPATPEKLTNNELLFNWIAEHPAAYVRDICDAFDKQIAYNSVQSQVHSLAARGILHKVECSSTGKLMYSTAMDTYPRSDRTNSVAQMNAARASLGRDEIARRISEGHKAKHVAKAEKKIILIKRRTPEPVATPAVQVTPVDLNTLSIVQARKLYDELKQIFGA
jgi:hypothetical protein